MDCKTKLEHYLGENKVHFHGMAHPLAYTAQEVAASMHVHGKNLAKVVVVMANSWLVMLVLPATHQIDFARLRDALGTQDIRLAHENEFEEIFPDCDTGAMPPFGNLYGIPVCVDYTLAQDEEIVFQAGTHRETLKIAYKDYARLVKPIVADFARRGEYVRVPEVA